MTTAEKRELVRRLQEGKRRAKRERPQRLAQVESAMDEIEAKRKAEPDPHQRALLIREIQALGVERSKYLT